MERLQYMPERLNPGVTLDVESGTFTIFGRSCPENAVEFYKPVLQWIDDYKENPLEKTVFEFKLQYYNTASSKVIYAILSKLDDIYENGHDVVIKWFYSPKDESLLDAAEDFSSLISVPMEIISTT